jgi:hypothetical protein
MPAFAFRVLLLAALLAVGQSRAEPDAFDEEYETRPWQEIEVQLPAAPRSADRLSFYVSELTENRFFVDAASLTVGSDGVVRYVLQVVSGEGVATVSFEGMRCESREWRMYASGRRDGAWSKARRSQWSPIRAVASNRQHAALFAEYFCPDGVVVRTAEEAVDALRRGGHPSVKAR